MLIFYKELKLKWWTKKPPSLAPSTDLHNCNMWGESHSWLLENTHLQIHALPRNGTRGDVFGKYKNEMWKLRTVICVNPFPYSKGSKDKSHHVLPIITSVITIVCIPYVQKLPPKPTDWQITLWYLLWDHKMKTFIKCFPRCLNCTRKLIESRTMPASSCRTRFRCQNTCVPRWYSTFWDRWQERFFSQAKGN